MRLTWLSNAILPNFSRKFEKNSSKEHELEKIIDKKTQEVKEREDKMKELDKKIDLIKVEHAQLVLDNSKLTDLRLGYEEEIDKKEKWVHLL